MKKIILAVLMFTLFVFPAQAQQDLPEHLIHEALLSTMPPEYYPNSECFAEGHTVLGTQTNADMLEIYLAASVGGYGFLGGGFVEQNGWGGPCTVVICQNDGGEWELIEIKEIEDYSEIPDIMPSWAEERYFAQKEHTKHGEQIRMQLQGYLDSIGRTEPILSYSDVSGELSDMLTNASNLRNSMDEDYPLGCTTLERIEGSERYLYTRAWTPDVGGVDGFTYTGIQGTISVHGTTGVELLTRVRKDDGMEMESICIDVDLYQVTITLRDQKGSIVYLFPFDEENWTYVKPTVTRNGSCNMDTSRIDRKIESLPDAGKLLAHHQTEEDTGERILVYENAGEWERFLIVRNGSRRALRFQRRMGSEWETLWENDRIVPDGASGWADLSYRDADVSGGLRQYDRFTAHWGDTVSLYTGYEGEEHEAFSLMLSRDERGVWQVVRYNDHASGVHAYLFDDRILLNAGDFSQTQIGGLLFSGLEERRAASFSPEELEAAAQSLKKRVQKRDCIEYFAGAEPLYIAPDWKLTVPVYTAPRKDSLRAAKGKASVSFADWVTILGRDGDWMMVLYERSEGQYRVGWVDVTQDERLEQAAAFAMQLQFPGIGMADTNWSVGLSDDPANMDGGVKTLPQGTQLYILCDDMVTGSGELLYYVETYIDGILMRGFLPEDTIGNG